MSTASITIAAATTETPGDQCVVMIAVGWKDYLAVSRARRGRRRPKMVYLDGDLHLMSPDFFHEFRAENLSDLVKIVVEELDIVCVRSGSTTFRRRKKRGGAEADHSFYLANAAQIAGKTKLHLRVDPPPDLVIESVNTHDADESVEVWRRFGVPEVWVCDASALQILALQPDGRYAQVENSVSFPFLSAVEIFGWASRPQTGNDTAWIKDVRRWVVDVLLPRARGLSGGKGEA